MGRDQFLEPFLWWMVLVMAVFLGGLPLLTDWLFGYRPSGPGPSISVICSVSVFVFGVGYFHGCYWLGVVMGRLVPSHSWPLMPLTLCGGTGGTGETWGGVSGLSWGLEHSIVLLPGVFWDLPGVTCFRFNRVGGGVCGCLWGVLSL